ncbi:hypothetical protein Tco_1311202 [Tanacetum coccineum]
MSLPVMEIFVSVGAFSMYSRIDLAMTSCSSFLQSTSSDNYDLFTKKVGYAVSDGSGYAVSDGSGYAVSVYRPEQL